MAASRLEFVTKVASLTQGLLVPAAIAAVIAVASALATFTKGGQDVVIRYYFNRLGPNQERSFRRWLIFGGAVATSLSSLVVVVCILATVSAR